MKREKIVALVFGAVLSIISISCKNSVSNGGSASFIAALDIVDTFISTGQASEALHQLKKAEKKAFSSFARLSIFKRYMKLGDEKNGEAVLQKALKKLPENPEISAVYAQFLLRRGKISEANKISECLKDTKYGSIYSECFFKLKEYVYEKEKNLNVYLEPEMELIYKDAFAGSKDSSWLVNQALVNFVGGKYTKAATLTPGDDFREVYSLEKSLLRGDLEKRARLQNYFWGLANYDAGKFATAIDFFEENIKDDSDFSENIVLKYLISDCYEFLGDSDSSQDERNLILEVDNIENPNLYLNSALWAEAKGDKLFEYKMLMLLVNEFPEFVPGLVAYGDFAVESNKERVQTSIERTLREKNIRTKQMEIYDSIPVVPVEDPVSRMKSVLETQKEIEKNIDYNLVVAFKNLQHKLFYNSSSTAKFADIWRTLEEYSTGKNIYPSQIAHWAICKFLDSGEEGRIEEARNIFIPYLTEKYLKKLDEKEADKIRAIVNADGELMEIDVFGGEKPKKREPTEYEKMTFYEKIASIESEMEVWECEVASYFAIREKDVASGTRILEYVINENVSKNLVSPSSKVNLAMILSSSGSKKEALSLYGEALGKTKNPETKAEILYRMAKVQLDLGDERSAILSLEYCLSQDPSHASARLLRGKLK